MLPSLVRPRELPSTLSFLWTNAFILLEGANVEISKVGTLTEQFAHIKALKSVYIKRLLHNNSSKPRIRSNAVELLNFQ